MDPPIQKCLMQAPIKLNLKNLTIRKKGTLVYTLKVLLTLKGNALQKAIHWDYYSLREKCSNTEFFVVRIFPYSDWIRRFTMSISVFRPKTGKYGPEKIPSCILFTQWLLVWLTFSRLRIPARCSKCFYVFSA